MLNAGRPGQKRVRIDPNRQANAKRGVTLIELLCVLCIIAILAAMNLSTIARVIVHVKKVLSG